MVLKAVLVTISSWFAAILVNLVTSLLVTYVGCSMSWFSHPTLLLPLYLSPAFLAMAAVHYSWFTSVRYYCFVSKHESALCVKFCALLYTMVICSEWE